MPCRGPMETKSFPSLWALSNVSRGYWFAIGSSGAFLLTRSLTLPRTTGTCSRRPRAYNFTIPLFLPPSRRPFESAHQWHAARGQQQQQEHHRDVMVGHRPSSIDKRRFHRRPMTSQRPVILRDSSLITYRASLRFLETLLA